MNTSRLRDTIERLLRAESDGAIQARLAGVHGQLSNLTNSPHDSTTQQNFAEALRQFHEVYSVMRSGFEPAEIKRIEDIAAGPFYVEDIPGDIRARLSENPAMPAVVLNYVADVMGRREQFINGLEELRARLSQIGINASDLQPGEAEVGFTIPRTIFRNELDGLIEELREIRFIVRAFSEASIGAAEEIVVKQISTTDPLFFLGLSATTVLSIGKTVHWILDTWKKIEDIREVREKTRKLKIENAQSIVDMFDANVKRTVDSEIERKVADLLKDSDGKTGRSKELNNHLDMAIHSLYARIERGMTVEIRFIAPPEPADTATAESGDAAPATPFVALAEVAPQLVFPPPAAAPILPLSGPSSSTPP